MRYSSLIAVVISAALLPACRAERAALARSAQETMIGLPREQVLACMGAPANQAAVGETEVWSYMSGNGEVVSSAFVSGGGGFASGIGTRSGRYCKIDVVMTKGIVSRVNYSGPTGGLLTEGEQCAFAVKNCVRPSS